MPQTRNDRFGNPFQVIACKDRKGRGFPSGVVEIGGNLYKLEPSSSNKEGVDAWIRVTKLARRQGGGGFGGGNGGGGFRGNGGGMGGGNGGGRL